MCAGFALLIGHKAAYSTDILMSIIQIWTLAQLYEIQICPLSKGNEKNIIHSIKAELAACFIKSLSFLKNAKKAVFLMFCNSLVGAIDILLLFFLQAKLPEAGIPKWGLGLVLFFMETGSILGAKIILKFSKMKYRHVFIVTACLVLCGVLAEHSSIYFIMTVGGFIAACSDDALQVRTNAILQDMFPSKQRATLISIESFTFSMIMIILSPFAGILFSQW